MSCLMRCLEDTLNIPRRDYNSNYSEGLNHPMENYDDSKTFDELCKKMTGYTATYDKDVAKLFNYWKQATTSVATVARN